MGSIIAETTSAEKVEHLIKPVKDLFGAVFFVSVGMMIDPKAIAEFGIPVLVVTLLTLFGKLFSTRSEEHTSELQSLMRISYSVFRLKKKNTPHTQTNANLARDLP